MFRVFRSPATAIAICVLLAACSSSKPSPSDDGGSIPAGGATQAPLVYPPKTIEQVRTLALSADATRIQVIRRENRPNGSCERPNVYAITDQGLHGQALAAAELATFQDESAFTATCPAFLYVFHNRREMSQPGYTAGAVILDGGLLEVYVGGVTTEPVIKVATA
jgi:hypothetical protein